MKSHWAYYVFFILLINSYNSNSAIRNGYENGIAGARTSLQALELSYSSGNLNSAQRNRVKDQIKQLSEFVHYYEMTESRIAEFKLIAPLLYDAANALTDARGRSVDVFIRFVDLEVLPSGIYATTNLEQGKDEDAYKSGFGEHTVSIVVRRGATELKKLAHELGHVVYQVPNLATYTKYYTNLYEHTAEGAAIGHDAGDPSGISAGKFERMFAELSFSARKTR